MVRNGRSWGGALSCPGVDKVEFRIDWNLLHADRLSTTALKLND